MSARNCRVHAGDGTTTATGLAQVAAPTLPIVGGHDTALIESHRDALRRLGCEKRSVIVPGVAQQPRRRCAGSMRKPALRGTSMPGGTR